MSFTWLREALQMHFLPMGSTSSPLAAFGESSCMNNFRTDKPLVFNQDLVDGLSLGLQHNAHKEWLVFCYSPMPYYQHRPDFFVDAFNSALIKSGVKGRESISRYQSLVLLAALEARLSINGQRSFINGPRLAELMKVKNQSWRKTWAPRWKILVDEFKHYDQRSLLALENDIDHVEKKVS